MKNIPKKIHLIWFGDEEPNVPYLHKIRTIYSNYQIKLWREVDFDIENACPFVKMAYKEKKWQFLSDYYKMYVLHKEGGIYLEADMEPVKKLEKENDATLVLGYEHNNSITKGFIACTKSHRFTTAVMNYYESLVNPSYFLLSQVALTEILYSQYPNLGFENETKRSKDLQMFDSNAFGLWKEKKNVDTYFIHRRDLNYSHSSINRFTSRIWSKFNKVTPPFIQTRKGKTLRKQMEKSMIDSLKSLPIQTVNEINDTGYLTKELFDKIISYDHKVRVHLHYKNERLGKLILKIYNVAEVTYGNEDSQHNFDDHIIEKIGITNDAIKSSQLIFEYNTVSKRPKIEVDTNIYNRLFASGVKGILEK